MVNYERKLDRGRIIVPEEFRAKYDKVVTYVNVRQRKLIVFLWKVLQFIQNILRVLIMKCLIRKILTGFFILDILMVI